MSVADRFGSGLGTGTNLHCVLISGITRSSGGDVKHLLVVTYGQDGGSEPHRLVGQYGGVDDRVTLRNTRPMLHFQTNTVSW